MIDITPSNNWVNGLLECSHVKTYTFEMYKVGMIMSAMNKPNYDIAYKMFDAWIDERDNEHWLRCYLPTMLTEEDKATRRRTILRYIADDYFSHMMSNSGSDY